MFIIPGVTYKLTFITGFEELDGLYTIMQLLSNEEMVINEYTVEDTYTELGKTEDEFIVDKPTYFNNIYVKIRSIENDKIYFISELMLENIPDFSAKKYYNLGLLVDLGIYGHQDDLSGITLTIRNLLETNYGITTNPIVMTHGKDVWLTDTEYNIIKTTRESNKGTIENPYTVIQNQLTELTSLRQRVLALENLLIDLQP